MQPFLSKPNAFKSFGVLKRRGRRRLFFGSFQTVFIIKVEADLFKMDSTSSSGDDQTKNLNAKYQKLAAEYAKLRSQVAVLKKAVLDEQQKQEGLKQLTTSQDQSIRKLEQELDSVKFRNRQLEKRIEILQEPQQQQINPKLSASGGQSSGGSSSIDPNILIHVEQNKKLQEQVVNLNEKYSTEVSRLKRMIDHEMVPKQVLENISKENSERISLLNRKVSELVDVNNDLNSKLMMQQQQQAATNAGSDGSGQEVKNIEVEQLNKLLMESEVKNEGLSSEVQILRMKLRRYEDVKSPTSPMSGSEAQITSLEQTNMIGRMIGSPDIDKSDELNHLKDRMTELVKLARMSDSKAIHYYSECLNLCRLVRNWNINYKRLDSEFGKLKVKYREISDELEDTTRNYNEQVNSLTEHIALLNEKLTGYVEEVVRLKSK